MKERVEIVSEIVNVLYLFTTVSRQSLDSKENDYKTYLYPLQTYITHLCAGLEATEGSALPLAAGDQLERTSCDLFASRGHTCK